MAFSLSCRHTARVPFRGMKLVGFPADDRLQFECPNCGAVTIVPRCEATTTLGKRCGNAVFGTKTKCVVHGFRAVANSK